VAWRRYIGRALGILAVANKLRQNQPASEGDWAWLWDVGSLGQAIGAGRGLRVQKLFYGSGKASPKPADRFVPVTPARFRAAGRAMAYLLSSSANNPNAVALAMKRRHDLPAQKETLAYALNHWLDECEVGLCFEWTKSESSVRLGTSYPFGGGGRPLIAIGAQLLCAVLQRDVLVNCSACGGLYPPKRQPRRGESHYCENCGRKAANRFAQRRYRARIGTSE